MGDFRPLIPYADRRENSRQKSRNCPQISREKDAKPTAPEIEVVAASRSPKLNLSIRKKAASKTKVSRSRHAGQIYHR